MKLAVIGALVLALLALSSAAECGVEVEYVHPSGSGSTKQDCLEMNVCLTRYEPGPIYNAGQLTVEWACGKCSEASTFYSSDDYPDRDLWREMKDNCFRGSNNNIPGSDTCLHVVSSDNYYDLAWTSWDSGKDEALGGFAYKRTLFCTPEQGTAAAGITLQEQCVLECNKTRAECEQECGYDSLLDSCISKYCPESGNCESGCRCMTGCDWGTLAECEQECGLVPPVAPPAPKPPATEQPADNTMLYIVGLLVVIAAVAVLYLKRK